jgi:hypothetical protein
MNYFKKSFASALLALLVTLTATAQVGVGTNSPNASAQLDVSSTTKGLLPPRMTTAQRNNISNPANGLIIFNSTSNSLNVFLLGNWYQLSATLPSGSIGSLSVGSASNTGTLYTGLAASGVSSVISYTGGNGETHSGQAVSSTGVTGLTATLSSGIFVVGAGTLTYTITGTPSGGGTASFALNIGGQTGTLTRLVDPGSISSLSASSPINNGTLYNGLSASGVSSVVAYTGGSGGPHVGQTVASTGVTGLTATLTSGNFVVGSGTLTYTITGTPSSGGTASFALSIGGQSATLTRTVEPGSIASLSAGSPSNTGSLISGLAASGVSSAVSYSGGNGQPHSGQTVASTGVTGFTATLASGNFAVGGGTLTYTITGTGTSTGTANFALDIGGQNATLSIEVVTLAPGVSYQGGKVAYVLQSGDPGYNPAIPHGLIVATTDQSAGIQWGPNSTTGVTATAIGSGLNNTNTIITSQGGSASSYAASVARTYNGGGYTDWYLPSKDELQKVYDNRVAVGNNFSTDVNVRYWTSSECGCIVHSDKWGAWNLYFGNGNWAQYEFANPFRVRAVRSF